MTTTDTDALTERIAMAWNECTPEQWAEIDRHRHGPGLKGLALRDAARVLPIVAEEVRKAKAEALREAAGDIVWSAETLPHMTPHDAAWGLVRRADRIETGGSDDRR